MIRRGPYSGFRGRAPVQVPLPAWVPAVGSRIALPLTNTFASALPSMYASNVDRDAMFQRWTSSAVLRDFGTHGATGYQGGGHQSGGLNVLQGMMLLAYGSSGGTWLHRLRPSITHNDSVDHMDLYGRFDDGSTMPQHTYNGVQEVPASWGLTGASGGMSCFGFAGSTGYHNCVNVFDAETVVGNPTQLIDEICFAAAGQCTGVYAGSAIDLLREGWWYQHNSAADRLAFLHKSGSVSYQAVGWNTSGSSLAMARHPGLDVLVGVGTRDRPSTNQIYVKTCWASDSWQGIALSLGSASKYPCEAVNTNNGSLVYSSENAGMVWSVMHQCMVMWDSINDPDSVYTMRPSTLSDAFSTWVLNRQTPTVRDGSTMPDCGANPMYGKLGEVPAIGGFVATVRADQAPIYFRLDPAQI